MKIKAILFSVLFLFVSQAIAAPNPFAPFFNWGDPVPAPEEPILPTFVSETDEEQRKIRSENAKKMFCEQLLKGRSSDENCIKGNGINNSIEYLGAKQFFKYTIKIHPEKYCMFKPKLKFESVPIGQADCFAGYIVNKRLYIMLQDLDGTVDMQELHPTGVVMGYKVIDLDGELQWQCLAFEKKKFLPELLLADGVTFYIAIAAKGDLSTIQGAAFIFEIE